jgi:hypothetical protein
VPDLDEIAMQAGGIGASIYRVTTMDKRGARAQPSVPRTPSFDKFAAGDARSSHEKPSDA